MGTVSLTRVPITVRVAIWSPRPAASCGVRVVHVHFPSVTDDEPARAVMPPATNTKRTPSVASSNPPSAGCVCMVDSVPEQSTVPRPAHHLKLRLFDKRSDHGSADLGKKNSVTEDLRHSKHGCRHRLGAGVGFFGFSFSEVCSCDRITRVFGACLSDVSFSRIE